MHLCVQLSDVVESRHTLQTQGHVMQVRRDSVPLKSRRIGFCTIEDLIPGGYILHPLLHMSTHLANYAVVLVHGVASASNQGLGYILRELGHLEDGRKARERGQAGEEFEVSEVGKIRHLHLRENAVREVENLMFVKP